MEIFLKLKINIIKQYWYNSINYNFEEAISIEIINFQKHTIIFKRVMMK